MIAGNAATAKRSCSNSGQPNTAALIGFATGADKREWRLCHSSHSVAAGKLGDSPAAIGRWLAEMAAVSRIGAEQIEVEVVRVIGVAARTEHGVELCTGSGEGSCQESPFRRSTPPPIPHHADLAPVGEPEGGDVERIAE